MSPRQRARVSDNGDDTRSRGLHAALETHAEELFVPGGQRGKETVTRVVEMTAGHDLNHLKQIRERLQER